MSFGLQDKSFWDKPQVLPQVCSCGLQQDHWRDAISSAYKASPFWLPTFAVAARSPRLWDTRQGVVAVPKSPGSHWLGCCDKDFTFFHCCRSALQLTLSAFDNGNGSSDRQSTAGLHFRPKHKGWQEGKVAERRSHWAFKTRSNLLLRVIIKFLVRSVFNFHLYHGWTRC